MNETKFDSPQLKLIGVTQKPDFNSLKEERSVWDTMPGEKSLGHFHLNHAYSSDTPSPLAFNNAVPSSFEFVFVFSMASTQSFPIPNVLYRIQSVDSTHYLELYDVNNEVIVMRPSKDCLEQHVSSISLMKYMSSA